ncbi:hypothetical protein [Salinisphaera hydrothermalis]|uniref:Signal peptide protein n=1 Tax=Salinisphaera hydrothermalis (strain C41B8) TaxID=1304275 RepID=A0A084IHH0_SALHC|nr:hypothetical protein [Salinisphaera hydrothermalis]KEZ76154.1 signal peptide protein [Salinisphaera hydrothermalis C41B8]
MIAAAAALVGVSSIAGAAPAPSERSSTIGNGLGAPVSAQTLSAYRGGHVFQLSEANLSAQLSDNQASNNITGSNVVGTQAFSGSSGIPTVIQNSGNNVIIQNATILNLQMQ